jgi:hypothetical protein
VLKVMYKAFLGSLFVTLVSGCAAKHRSADSMASAEYQSRDTLTQSLLDGETLSEPAIQKILSSKIKLPKTIQLAVLRLPTGYGDQFQIDDEMVDQFYGGLEKSGRIKAVIPVPSALVSMPPKITSMRLSAVLLQADMLLVIQPRSDLDWKFRMFEANKAKAQTTVQAFLLDTRTSVIPYTALISKTAEVSKEGKDYSEYDAMKRAKLESEKLVLKELAAGLSAFVGKVP